MRNPFRNTNTPRTQRARLASVLLVSASAMFAIAGVSIVSNASASAAPVVAQVAATGPCTVTVTGGGQAVPSTNLIAGVVAGTTKLAFDCNTSVSPAIVAEASLLAALGSSNVLPTSEADTSALGTFTASATDTGCPAGVAGQCSTATFAVPTTFSASGDANAVCPPTQAQINAGVFGCAIAVADKSEAEIAGGEYLLQYASSAATPPAAPTIAALQTTGSPGSLINVSDAANNTGYWWGNALQPSQALASQTVAQTAPANCTVGYGNVPSAYLEDAWFITGTSTEVGGGSATGVTISNDCYSGSKLSPPVLGGTITVPATVTSGTKYTVYLCEVNLTPYPSNDTNAAANCGTAAPSFIDASFTFTAAAKDITQNLPVTNSVAPSASSTFKDQLVTSGNNGTVTYTQTAGTPSIVVSSTGAVSTSGALAAGSYTASGTTSDASGDTGTFTYALTVTGTTPPVTKPAPKATRVDGYAVPGRTVVVTILGKNFTARPRIIGHAGTVVSVVKTTATKIVVRVREVKTAHKGTFKLTIQFASGKKTSVNYTVR
jgi:hypothetical protein